jgi:hypothetical protein
VARLNEGRPWAPLAGGQWPQVVRADQVGSFVALSTGSGDWSGKYFL